MPKNIVICMDGTGNEYGDNLTNVVETYKLAIKNEEQVVFYDPGVGTGGYLYDDGIGKIVEKYDKATGTGVHRNVEQAYRYLMEVWDPGDKIFLFGFSRGAFAARSLAGMLFKIGLLPRGNDNQLEYASKYYIESKYRDITDAFKRDMCRACPVHFIGVWDTVDSRLLAEGLRFSDTTLNQEVSFAYQAMAINEKRRDFPVSVWSKPANKNQTVKQVWFAGVHSNVGGWYANRGPSNITLFWMMNRAMEAGMFVDENKLESIKAAQDDTCELNESCDGFWKIRGSRYRKIETLMKNKSKPFIHQSVINRMEADPDYKKLVMDKNEFPTSYDTEPFDD